MRAQGEWSGPARHECILGQVPKTRRAERDAARVQYEVWVDRLQQAGSGDHLGKVTTCPMGERAGEFAPLAAAEQPAEEEAARKDEVAKRPQHRTQARTTGLTPRQQVTTNGAA